MGQLLSEISAKELTEWRAYDQLDPIGDYRQDLQAAQISATIANANRDPKKRRRPFDVNDFVLRFKRPIKDPQQPGSARSLYRTIRANMILMGAKDPKRKAN